MIPMETARLRLRRLELRDAVAVQAYAGDWDVVRYLADVPYPYPAGFAERWIASTHGKIRSGTDFSFAIARKDVDDLIGTVQLKIDDRTDGGEVGYWLGRPFWGQGYATEAVNRMVVFAFNRVGLHRVWAAALLDNRASERVLEKVGLHNQGLGTYDFPARGGIKQVTIFALTREEAAEGPAALSAAVTRV